MLITLNILEDYLAQNGFETEIRGEEVIFLPPGTFSFRHNSPG